jgi:hypothetical protein
LPPEAIGCTTHLDGMGRTGICWPLAFCPVTGPCPGAPLSVSVMGDVGVHLIF